VPNHRFRVTKTPRIIKEQQHITDYAVKIEESKGRSKEEETCKMASPRRRGRRNSDGSGPRRLTGGFWPPSVVDGAVAMAASGWAATVVLWFGGNEEGSVKCPNE